MLDFYQGYLYIFWREFLIGTMKNLLLFSTFIVRLKRAIFQKVS